MNASRRSAVVAALTIICMTSGSTAMSSLFVIYRRDWNLTSADIAIVFTAYVCSLLPSLLFGGGLAERFGRRTIAAVGIAFMASGIVCITQAHELAHLIIARLLQGAGVGLSIGAVTAAFTEAYAGKLTAGNAMQSITAVGLFAGPVVSALAFDAGWGLQWSFVPGLISVVALLALVRFLNERPTNVQTAAPLDEPYAAPIVYNALRFAMPLVFVSWAGLSLFLSLVPSYLAATLHAENPLIGAVALVSAQVTSLIVTLRLGKIAPERGGIIAAIATVLGLALLVAGTSANAWVLIILATLLVGAGGGVASALSFGIATRAGRGQRARVFSKMYIAAYLGYSVPALALGIIAAHTSFAVGFIAIIALLAVITLALPFVSGGEKAASAALAA